MASASYAQLVARTSSLLFHHEDLKGIITAAKAGDMLAVLDPFLQYQSCVSIKYYLGSFTPVLRTQHYLLFS